MLRTAMRPRFLALLALALALASGFAWLGDWQLSRARDEAAQQARAEAEREDVADLSSVLRPATELTPEAVRRLVTAAGTLDTGRLLEVPERDLAGEPGRWLLAPLEVDGGGTLPTVLGWLPDGEAVPAAGPDGLPSGQVRLTGRLEQGEAPYGVLPEEVRRTGRIPGVSSVDLVNLWRPPLYTAYLAVTDPVPAPLRPVPASEPPSGFALQNLSYALQWWLFAGFAVFFWWRLVRDTAERGAEASEPEWVS